jgi:2-oxoglutarate dehydrogenase E2 component (dihydrolipoamide succinyltransferase)
MKIEIKVPSVGESVTEVTVATILKESGSLVQKNEDLLELETDKVNQVVVAPEAGLWLVQVNIQDKLAIGHLLGVIDTEKAVIEKAPVKEPLVAQPALAPSQIVTPSTHTTGGVRKSEEEYLQTLGQKPAIIPHSANKDSLDGEKRVRMSGLRKTIAQRLVEVKNTTAMLTTFNEVDMSQIIAIRAQEKEAFEKRHGVKLGFLSFFVTACSSALKKFPEVNAYLEGDEMVYHDHHHIGIAVSTDKGLLVPVLRSCEELSFAQIEGGVAEFAKKARDGKIGIQDLKGGTFTITNGGVFGSLLSTPILNPPQSAILGMHKILERAVVVEHQIVIRPMMYLALSYDHRIIDGKEAVGFLVHVKECLENPSKLLLQS